MNCLSLFLIGGGGHCASVIDVLDLCGSYRILGIVDEPSRVGESVLGYPIVATDAQLPDLTVECRNFLVTVGQLRTAETRRRIYDQLKKMGAHLPKVVSPLAYVSKHAVVGEGTVIHHYAIVNANASVGANCIINTRALVEHDAVVGDHCHVSTGSILNGGVEVGAGTFFGSGAVSKQSVRIPAGSFVKANSVYKG